MNRPEDWCIDQFQKLQIEELRIPALGEIKNYLESISDNQLARTVNLLDIPLVFDCLNDSKTEQIDLACEVLSLCLGNMSVGESTSRYGIPLERALSHPHPAVKSMALAEIERNVRNEDVLIELCNRTSLLCGVIRCAGAEDIGIYARTSNILKLIGSNDAGISRLTGNDVVRAFRDVQALNEINRLRVFEILANISIESRSNLDKLRSAGLITPIIRDLDNNDVLLRINIIEILSRLASADHGYEYLENEKVFSILTGMLRDDDAMTTLVEPGVLKFFGHVSHRKPLEIVEKYPHIVKRMLSNLSLADPGVLGVSLDSIGYIAVNDEGKIALDSLGEDTRQGIKTVARRLGALTEELKIRALKFFENLVRSTGENRAVFDITKRWFSLLGTDPMIVVWNYCKNPFVDIRLGGFGVLNALSGHVWGHEVIRDTPGLVEFILDRNSEVHKDCKLAKYDIVRLLSTSSAFGNAIQTRLNAYVKEGAFYVQGMMETAFEGNQ